VANALWADASTTPRQAFVDTVRSYGADFRTADFRGAAEAARQEINKWVSDRTNGRIPELFGAGAITAMTRLVIANAIYFKGRWENEFAPSATTSRPFHRAGASAVNVPTMHGSLEAGYTSAKDFRAVDLPYRGGRFSMLVILPRKSMSAVERRLSGAFIASTAGRLRTAMVKLALPRFEFRGSYALNAPLKKLGMKLAFDSRRANLGAMFAQVDGRPFISNAIHKTFIHVDEQGTEAAAATGIDVGTTAAPAKQVTLTVDRPFLAIIRDSGTGVPLFIVRVTDPRR